MIKRITGESLTVDADGWEALLRGEPVRFEGCALSRIEGLQSFLDKPYEVKQKEKK